MVAFYNAADQELYKKYQYLPQEKYRLGLNLPTNTPVAPPPPISGGITNTNAFTNSDGNNFNPAGNAFGEGTAVNPVYGNTYIDTVRREGVDSLPAYERLIDAGGTAPAGMFQTDYFPGTENELADAMGRMPGQEGYAPNMDYSEDAFQKADDKRGFLSRLMNNAKQSMTNLPSWAQTAITAAGLVNPFTAIPKLIGMGGGDGGPSYGIAGLSDTQKQYYDALAGEGFLYDGPGGMKTLDGKNFSRVDEDTINDYFKGKIAKHGSIENYEKYINDPKYAGRRKNLGLILNQYKTLQGINDFNYRDNLKDIGASNIDEAAFAGRGGNKAAQQQIAQQQQATIDQANRDFRAGRDDGYSDGSAGRQFDNKGNETGYNDPFDPGGGEKDGGFIDGTNRRPFAYGGLASIL